MTDPSPFLSTIASSSAALVAIIGGLLVARFVTLDSEQQGAQHLLDDGEQRLRKAQQREKEARDDLRRWDIREFFTREVIDSIGKGECDLAQLREIGPITSLANEDMTAHVTLLVEEFELARDTLRPLIPKGVREQDFGYWESFKRQTPSLPENMKEDVWSKVYSESFTPEPRRSIYDTNFSVGTLFPTPPEFIALRGQRHDGLIDDVDEASKKVEDLEGEVTRLTRARDLIVRPKGLGAGLLVLALFTVVGVIYPIWLMGHAPKDLNRGISHPVFIMFSGALVILFGYMGWLALRLSRGKKPSGSSSGGQPEKINT